jgi:uncharacterized Zn-finger protein
VHNLCDVDKNLVSGEGSVKGCKAECSYLCDVCKKSFKTKSYLQIHKHLHSRQYHYACNVCNKQFYFLCYLKRHMHIYGAQQTDFFL